METKWYRYEIETPNMFKSGYIKAISSYSALVKVTDEHIKDDEAGKIKVKIKRHKDDL